MLTIFTKLKVVMLITIDIVTASSPFLSNDVIDEFFVKLYKFMHLAPRLDSFSLTNRCKAS